MKRTSNSLQGRRLPPARSSGSPKQARSTHTRDTARKAETTLFTPSSPRSAGGPGGAIAEAPENPQSTKLDIAVDRSSPLWAALPEAEELAERVILAAAKSCGVKLREATEVSVQLTDDAQIRALNARWRGFDKPTNVLSFPASPVERLASAPLLGDIVIAYETTRREADDDGISLRDHFVHLVVHGFLHLVGFDHQDDREADEMEALETRVLAGMSIADPYRRSVPAERE